MARITQKKQQYWLFPCLALLFTLVMTRGTVQYWEGDTLEINKIAEVARSFPYSGYLVFLGWPLSLFVRLLYLISDAPNWFAIMLLWAVTWSFLVINQTVISLLRSFNHITMSLLMAISFSVNVFALLHLDFTAEAFLMMTAVIVRFFFSDLKWQHWIEMATMTLFSFCLRYFTVAKLAGNSVSACYNVILRLFRFVTYPNASIVVIGIAAPLFLGFCIFKKKLWQTLGFSAMLVLISIVCALISAQMEKRYALNEYIEFRTAIAQNLDYSARNVLSKQSIERAGFTANDCDLLFSWIYADKNIYTKEKLVRLYEEIPQSSKMNLSLFSLAASFFLHQWTRIMILIFCVLGYFLPFEKKTLLLYAGNTMCTFASAFILFILKRVMMRILLPLYFAGFCIAVCLLIARIPSETIIKKRLSKAWIFLFPITLMALLVVARPDSRLFACIIFITDGLYLIFLLFSKKNKVFACAVTLITCIVILLISFPFISEKKAQEKSQTDKIDVVKQFLQTHEGAILLCAMEECDKPVKLWHNQLETAGTVEAFGGWMFMTPYFNKELNRYGLSEYRDTPVKALLRENVYLLLAEEHTMRLATFLQEHYPEKHFIVVRVAEPHIYQFVSSP